MTFGSLFSGIGGVDLGLERAGMECRWQVEIDPWCRRVLAKHWPNVARYEDVRDVGRDNLEPVDLIAGGFPCQPFSLAGRRRGEGDDRNLWPEMRRLVDELRPRWVLAENVPGIIGLYLDTVLSDLEALGYATGAVVLPACAFDAPHIRQRLFVVAHNQGVGGERSIGKRDRTRQPQTPARDGIRGEVWGALDTRVLRMADGIPNWVDRLTGLGNAVVPQVIEHIGRTILSVHG